MGKNCKENYKENPFAHNTHRTKCDKKREQERENDRMKIDGK